MNTTSVISHFNRQDDTALSQCTGWCCCWLSVVVVADVSSISRLSHPDCNDWVRSSGIIIIMTGSLRCERQTTSMVCGWVRIQLFYMPSMRSGWARDKSKNSNNKIDEKRQGSDAQPRPTHLNEQFIDNNNIPFFFDRYRQKKAATIKKTNRKNRRTERF